MDNGLPCDNCGAATYMHCHVEGVPTLCRDCGEDWDNRRAAEDEERHQAEMFEIETRQERGET